MALRYIICLPDPRLRLISKAVEVVDDSIRALMDEMLETMYEAPGIGLAAIQIAEPLRVVVIDVAKKDDPPAPMFFVNPELLWASDDKAPYEEGCLSIPEYYEIVERPTRVKVRYLDRMGAPQEIEAEGLLATCLQHEIDHTNGVLFVDYLSRLKRERVMKKFQKAARLRESEQA
jgi:peptide deformylase